MITIVMLFINPTLSQAKILDDVAVKCIMGEARGESYEGKLAIAEALRNRNHTSGVYGCKAYYKEPEWVWEQARRAWAESKTSNLVDGANHWGSTIVDKKWIDKMYKTMTYKGQVGNHKFFEGR